MTLYITNSQGGEMTPLDLTPLARPPRRTIHNRPVRRPVRRAKYVSRPQPLNDLLLAVSAFLVALAFFAATTVWPA